MTLKSLSETSSIASQHETLPSEYRELIDREEIRAQSLRLKHQKSPSRRILLIGGAGYIGSVLTPYLLNLGFEVTCLDVLLYQNDFSVLPFLTHPRYRFVYGDLLDKAKVQTALEGVSDVVLLAGLVGDPVCKKYPTEAQLINQEGISQLLPFLNGQGLNKVIFISTCSNYGIVEENILTDETYPLKPISPYSQAKVNAERLLLSRTNSIDYVPTILRFATAFGISSRMRFDLTVNEFSRDLFLKKELVVYDADSWRPYCHVQDFAGLILAVLHAPEERVGFEVFNAGSEANNATKRMIVEQIQTFIPNANVRYLEKGVDQRNYRVNFKKVRDRLYFQPRWPISTGILEILRALGNRLLQDESAAYGNYVLHYSAPEEFLEKV